MILSGGVNVYTSEVERVLLEHPGIADAVVIGLPDAEWGKRVHALLTARGIQPQDADVMRHCRDNLAPAKVPKSIEWLAAMPRDELGKVRRSALVAERVKEGLSVATE